MSSKSMKATKPVPAPLTEEEKKAQIARFLSQKRESFAQGILFNLCEGHGSLTSAEGVALVDRSLEMADYFLEKLYNVNKAPEEK